jgi:hypothetical protein
MPTPKTRKRFNLSEEKQKETTDFLCKSLAICEGSRSESLWRTESEEDYRFYAGDQDSEFVKAELANLRRPCTTWNEVKPKIDILVGIGAQMKSEPTLVPVGMEDEALTELCQGVLKHFRRKLSLHRREIECFTHMVKSGRSYQYYYIDATNPFKPAIKTMRLDGHDCFKDPKSTEYDLSDARFFFFHKWLTEDEAKVYWPDIPIQELSNYSNTFNGVNLTFFDLQSGLVRVVEGWYRKFEKVFWFINPLTQKEEWLREEDFKTYNKGLMEGISLPNGETLQLPNGVQAYESYKNNIYYAIFSGDRLLEYGISPYRFDSFPIVQYGAYLDDVNNRWFSAITMQKDPQRGLNTMRRQLQHLLQTSPRGILMHEVGAILNVEDYEERGADPTYHMETAQGAVSSGKIKFSDQPQISPIYQYLDATNQQGMKDVAGVQDPLLGIQTTSREPTSSVSLRQESSIAVLYILYMNFSESRRLSTKILLGLIQQFVPDETVIRIEGENGMQLISVNTQLNPQVAGWNDITTGEFDMEIDEEAENVTTRLATMRMLTDFALNNPGAIPVDVLLEFANIPFSVKQRVKEYQILMMEREDARFAAELAVKSASKQNNSNKKENKDG